MKITEAADKQISALEQELQKYDSLEHDVETSKATITQLESDVVEVRSNRDLEPKARVAKLQSAGALLTLEKGDLETLQKSVEAQRARVVAAGRLAKIACQPIASALSASRTSTAKAAIDELLDLSKVGAIVQGLELTARTVVELQPVIHFFNQSSVDDFAWARQSRMFFDQLRSLAEAENLDTPAPSAKAALQ